MASKRIKGITIEIDGNVTPLQKKLASLDSSLSKTQASLRDVNKLLKTDPSNVELLTQKQKLLTKAIDDTKTRVSELKSAQALMVDESGNVKDGYQDAYDSIGREISATESKLKSLTEQQKQFGSVTAQQWKLAGEKISEVSSKVTDVGTNMTKYVTAPIAAGAGAAVAAFNDVDGAMDTVITKTGATGEALEEMQQSVKNLATTIPTDFSTAGEAIGEVSTRFGLTGQALEDLSGQFIKFAQLNNTDVSTSIDEVQKALSAFGKSSDEAGTMLDVLNRTSQNTGVKIETLTSGLVKNAAAFEEMGLSAEQSIALLGQIEMSGADTETAMNGLRKALKNAAAQGKPLTSVLSDLQEEILNNDDSTQALNDTYEIFGKSGDQIYQAIKNGTIDFEDLSDQADILADSMDSVSSTFEATVDPTDRLQEVLNELKSLGADIGESMMPAIERAVDAIIPKIEELSGWWTNLSDDTQDMILKCAGFAAAAGPVVSIIGKLGSGVGSLVGGVGSLIGAVQKAGGFLAAIQAALAGPAGIVALVAALAGTVALGVWEGANNDLADSISEAKELQQTISDGQSDRKSAMDDMAKSATLAQDLKGKISDLQKRESLSNSEKKQMAIYVAQLNDLYPDLGLEIDDVTGKLEEESEARMENVDAIIAEAKAAKEQEHLQEIADQMIEIEDELKEKMTERTELYGDIIELQKQMADPTSASIIPELTGRMDEATAAYETLDGTIQELQISYRDLDAEAGQITEDIYGTGEAATTTSEQIGEAGTSIADTTSSALSIADGAITNTQANLDSLAQSYAESATQAYDSLMNQAGYFEQMDETTSTSLADMEANLSAHVAATKTYSDNLNTAMEWAASSTNENAMAIVQYLADMGMDGADEMQALVNAINDGSIDSSTILSDWGELSANNKTIAGNYTTLEDNTDAMRTKTTEDFRDAARDTVTHTRKMADTVTTEASQMATGMENGESRVRHSVDNLQRDVRRVSFNFRQHIALPHFSISGRFDAQAQTVPYTSVNWYRKAQNQPYFFDQPAVIGVGDVPEVVLGREKYDKLVNNTNNRNISQNVVININQLPGESMTDLAQRIKSVFTAETGREAASWA